MEPKFRVAYLKYAGLITIDFVWRLPKTKQKACCAVHLFPYWKYWRWLWQRDDFEKANALYSFVLAPLIACAWFYTYDSTSKV